MTESENITADESYAASYRVFWNAVSMLALDANGQCESMGNYNVAWELKDDVSAGRYLFNSTACPLSSAQKQGINDLIYSLQSVPCELLAQAISALENQKTMNHSCWAPLRVKAAQILQTLPKPEPD